MADILSRNTVESIIGEKVTCAIIRDLVLSSSEQLTEEQRKDPELGHIYQYLENPYDTSVNAIRCENWSRDFRLVEGLLFYAKYATSLGEMRVYIPQSLRMMISNGTEFAIGDIEKLFDEAGRNAKAKHEKWAKYYNRRRREVRIKVND
ncbi:hypothetical protein TNCV_3751411 [Trichonephila clavipes]|nr:hypothetical protein TNCV_3751411 [Trichonephila clavipes]